MKHPTGPVKRFHGLAEAAAGLGILFTGAGLLGRYHWGLELFSHYKPHLAICFLIYAVIEFALRSRRIAALSLLLALINGLPLLSLRFFAPPRSEPFPKDAMHLRILQANILTCNTNALALLQLVEKEQPDVVILQEPNVRWLNQLASLTNRYPIYATMPREDNFGAAIYCGPQASFAQILQTQGPDYVPLTLACFKANNRRLNLVGIHAFAPFNADHWQKRNNFTQALIPLLQQLPGARVITGDFNNTPWSTHFRTFLKTSGLRDSAQGRTYLPTWPTSQWLLRIPLDHCLHSPEVRILARRRGPNIGSDHFPLIIDIAF